MKFYFLLIVLLFIGMVTSAPSDYLELVSNTPNCGAFDIPVCETVYKIKNPSLLSNSNVDQTSFKLFFQELSTGLSEDTTNLQNIKLEYYNGVKWTTLDRKNFNLPMLPNSNNLLRITAKKVWKPTGYLNEERIENIDNIIGLFGYNYTEYAWWNSSYTYRRSVTTTADAASNRSVWILSQNLTQTILNGKLDSQGACARLTGSDETTLLFMENKYANLTTGMNATYLVLNDTMLAGANIRYLYYSNLTGCSYSDAFRVGAYNWSGLMRAFWFVGNTNNVSFQPDFPMYTNNWTVLTNPANTTLGGLGYAASFSNSFIQSTGNSRWNNFPTATIVSYFKSLASANFAPYTRGVLANRDIGITHSSKMIFTSDAGTHYLQTTSAWDTTYFHTYGIDLNGTGWTVYVDGSFNNSLANTTGIPNDVNKINTLGGVPGYALANFSGYMSYMLFFNRSLSYSEHKLLASWGSEPLGSETQQNTSGNIVLNSYDQITGLGVITNITISNSTYSVQINNTQTYTADFVNLPSGLVTIVFSNSSYYSTSIITTISNSSQTINAYLIPLSNPYAIFVRFHTANPQGNVISNVLITLRISNNIIGSSLTDGSGIAGFYLVSTKSYNLTAEATGFDTVSQMIMPVLSDLYITLGGTSGITNFNFLFANVTWYLTPDPRALFTNDSLINFTINSVDGNLEWYGLALTYNETTIFNQTNYTNPTGGTILVIVNLTGRSGHVFAHPYFKKVGYAELYDSSSPFLIVNEIKQYYNTSGSMGSFIAQKASLGVSDFAYAFILLAIGFAITILISRTLNISAGVVGLVVLAFIALFGIFSPLYSGITPNSLEYWGIFTWIIMVIISIIIIRYGGF